MYEAEDFDSWIDDCEWIETSFGYRLIVIGQEKFRDVAIGHSSNNHYLFNVLSISGATVAQVRVKGVEENLKAYISKSRYSFEILLIQKENLR